MDLELKGRTAIVTGASAGIGRGVAACLAAEGVTVVGAARRTELVEELAEQARTAGAPGSIAALRYDMTDPVGPAQLAREAAQLVGPIDILANVAGGVRPIAIDAGRDVWDEAMTVKFWGARDLTHELLPAMRERRWGRVVNVTGQSEPHRISGSHTGNAATHAWAKGLSDTVGREGITVNSVQPGRIHSEQQFKRFPTAQDEELESTRIPIGRFGDPEEVAALVVFLASERARYITGTVIPADGGFHRFAF
jgi:3-oxoacyl-[acyl-carrier protein] reductase